MNAKEVITVITNMLERNDDIFEETGRHLYFSEITAEKVQNLLDLYNKEKRKNEELLKKVEKNDLDDADLTTVYMSGFFDKQTKCRNKIKDKINELKREQQILKDNKIKDKMVYTPYQLVAAEILRLEELLKEI